MLFVYMWTRSCQGWDCQSSLIITGRQACSACLFFFFQAEDGIRDLIVTGVQTCALPISRAADAAAARFRKIHVLCNNAGVGVVGPTELATFADWDWVLGVNLGGTVNGIVDRKSVV